MATYLTRTQTTGDPKKWNVSVWIKRTDLTGDNSFSNIIAAPSGDQGVWIASDGQLDIYGTGSVRLKPKAKLRDTSAWYHVVVSYDSTQSTSSDRIKAYINGSQLTDFDTNNYPSLNEDSLFNVNGTVLHVGRRASSAEHYYKGYMAEMIFTDGYNYAPSTFGSTNANGVWVPNVSPSVTYGNNGFRLQFANSGSSADANGFGADTSGNNNHLASNALGTTPNSKDTPQNNFATWNLLGSNASSILEGGLKMVGDTGTSYSLGACSTIAFQKGKWYAEFKILDDSSHNIGLCKEGNMKSTSGDYQYQKGQLFYRDNGNRASGTGSGYGTNGSYGDTYTTGDIIGVAADMDNRNLYFYKNGTIQNSGTAAFTSSQISGQADSDIKANTFYSFFAAGYNDGIVQANFGNPTFTIASGNADANGYGNFEYAVPSGYYALCTKNLAQYGG